MTKVVLALCSHDLIHANCLVERSCVQFALLDKDGKLANVLYRSERIALTCKIYFIRLIQELRQIYYFLDLREKIFSDF